MVTLSILVIVFFGLALIYFMTGVIADINSYVMPAGPLIGLIVILCGLAFSLAVTALSC